MASDEPKRPGRKRYVLICPTCDEVLEVPLQGLVFGKDGRVLDGPGTATCPNGHTFDFAIGSLREAN